MRATTVKVDGELLKELRAAKSPSQSLTAFVRDVLRQELLRRKMAAAEGRYADFVRESADERAEIEEWESVGLERPPGRKRT